MGMTMSPVKELAARRAQDAASHGYNGRTGNGAELLRECAKAVRIGARKAEHRYGIPAVSADERAEYASELVARLIGEHGGRIPEPGTVAAGYLARRAQGLIMNDRERYDRVELIDGDSPGRDGGAAEPCGDDRLTGPLAVTAEVDALAADLGLSETAKRALAAILIPATREEWAHLYGYASGKAFHVTAWRGRAELYAIGEDGIREALARIESEV